MLHPFPDLISSFTQVSCSGSLGFLLCNNSSLQSTHLGRWSGGDATGSIAEFKTLFVQDDRKKCGKRKGEEGGEVYTSKGLSFLNEVCVVGGQGQHNSGHASVWCHVIQDSEKSLSLFTPGKSCRETSRSQAFALAGSVAVPVSPGWLLLQSLLWLPQRSRHNLCIFFIVPIITKSSVVDCVPYGFLLLSFQNTDCAPNVCHQGYFVLLRLLITPLL